MTSGLPSDFDPTSGDRGADVPTLSPGPSEDVPSVGRPGETSSNEMGSARSASTGAPTAPRTRAARPDYMVRPHRGRMVAGVAAGIARHFDLDPLVVRLAFVVLAVFGGLAVPLYVAAWLLVPDEGASQSVAEYLLDRAPAR